MTTDNLTILIIFDISNETSIGILESPFIHSVSFPETTTGVFPVDNPSCVEEPRNP